VSTLYRRIVLFLALGFVSNGTAQSNANAFSKAADISQAGVKFHLAANAPRPLVQALDGLQQKYGWVVPYEDPQYNSKTEVVESADPRFASAGVGTRPHIPNGGAFAFDFPAGTGASPDEEKTLGLMVEAYNQSSNPGRFEVRQIADQSFTIVGTGTRNDAGHIVDQKPILDTVLTIPTAARTGTETLNLLCRSISQTSHEKISTGIYPVNLFEHNQVRVGGTKLPARTLLANLAAATGRKLEWRLLFDPDSNSYTLNLHLAH